MDKLIITVSPTMPFYVTDQPDLSEPKHQAQAVVDACNAGASIAHVRARSLPGTREPDMEQWGELTSAVRAGCDIIVEFGASAMRPEHRKPLIDALHPEMGSLPLSHRHDSLYTFEDQQQSARNYLAAGVLPEWEVFNANHTWHLRKLIESGLIQPPYFCSLLGFGRDTEDWNPPTLQELQARLAVLPPDTVWAIGAEGPDQLMLQAAAISLGGHVNTGLEDDPPPLAPGRPAKSNAELVERIVRLAHDLGREVATPAEARQILGLPRKQQDERTRSAATSGSPA